MFRDKIDINHPVSSSKRYSNSLQRPLFSRSLFAMTKLPVSRPVSNPEAFGARLPSQLHQSCRWVPTPEIAWELINLLNQQPQIPTSLAPATNELETPCPVVAMPKYTCEWMYLLWQTFDADGGQVFLASLPIEPPLCQKCAGSNEHVWAETRTMAREIKRTILECPEGAMSVCSLFTWERPSLVSWRGSGPHDRLAIFLSCFTAIFDFSSSPLGFSVVNGHNTTSPYPP